MESDKINKISNDQLFTFIKGKNVEIKGAKDMQTRLVKRIGELYKGRAFSVDVSCYDIDILTNDSILSDEKDSSVYERCSLRKHVIIPTKDKIYEINIFFPFFEIEESIP